MNRVAVIGASGSGKTTFSAALARKLKATHVELDALHWEPNWRMADLPVFKQRVTKATEAERWVCDGSYMKVRDVFWARADTIVWLDPGLPTVVRRLVKRTATRWWSQEELWSGNRESLREHFSKDSLVLFAIKQVSRHRVEYPRALAEPGYEHLTLVHLTSPAAADRWLGAL